MSKPTTRDDVGRATTQEGEPIKAKRGPGRPRTRPVGEKAPLKPRLQVSYTPAERARWQAAADAAGLDLATWARGALNAAARLPPA